MSKRVSWPFGDLRRRHYGALLVDPPWRFRTWSDAGRDRCPDGIPRTRGVEGRSPEGDITRNQQRQNNPGRHYATMALEEIRALSPATPRLGCLGQRGRHLRGGRRMTMCRAGGTPP